MQKIHDEQNAKFTVKTGSTLLISPFTSGCRLTWPGAPDFKLLCDLEHPFALAGPQFPGLPKGSWLRGPLPSLTHWCWGSSLSGSGAVSGVGVAGRGACRSAAAELGKACPSQTTFTQSFCSIWVEFHKCLPKNTQEGEENPGQLQT